ncbi:MAG: hypothetical protein QGH20_10395, partial [Candidatus Latescibacteria bacterium]|nr:hypothetical protein [Candidatus Latescibacterota bacterium]
MNDILKACGLETSSGQSKDQVVGRVAEHIFDPIESAKTIESLSNDERHLLEQIAAQEMVVSVGELVSTEGSLTLTKDLVIKGLVLAGRDLKSDPLRRGRPFDLERLESAQVVCPKFVGPLLSGEPVEIPVRSVSGLVESQTSDLRDLEHDLAAMADAINEGGVRPLKSGLPGKRFMRQVNPSLRVPDHLKDVDRIEESTRLLFVFELLDSLGVVKRHRGRLVLSSLTDEIFAADITDRAQGLFEAWLESAWWHELYHVGTVCLARKSPDWDNGDGQIDDLPTHDGLISARRVVLDVLGQAASESWVLMDDIAEAIRISSRGFLMRPPNRTYYGRATIYTGVGEVGAAKPSFVWGGAIEREGSWHRVEGAFIKEVIATSLHWLGIVDIGSVAVEDGLDFSVCRLTQIGRWLAGGTARPVNRQQSGTARSIVVQPTFEVSVFPEGQDLSILWPLHRFAEPIGYETVRTYRLTAESV